LAAEQPAAKQLVVKQPESLTPKALCAVSRYRIPKISWKSKTNPVLGQIAL